MSASVQTAPKGAPTVAALLRDAYPRHAAKLAARAAGTTPDTARAWVAGRKAPSADVMLRMADACDRFATALENFVDDRRARRMAGPDAAPAGTPAAAKALT